MSGDVERFIMCALSDVKLFPEFVVAYCAASEHLLVDSGELIVRVQASVTECRNAQERTSVAVVANQVHHDEEIRKVAMQLHLLEQELVHSGSITTNHVAAASDHGRAGSVHAGLHTRHQAPGAAPM